MPVSLLAGLPNLLVEVEGATVPFERLGMPPHGVCLLLPGHDHLSCMHPGPPPAPVTVAEGRASFAPPRAGGGAGRRLIIQYYSGLLLEYSTSTYYFKKIYNS